MPRKATLHRESVEFEAKIVEHNALGPGVIGHILRNRNVNTGSYAAVDWWFHYDQVGSVMSESNGAGAVAKVHHQDAFGNVQEAWNTGLWGGDRSGWHHNTKQYDEDTRLVYMYQRWYLPETGTFLSSAPYPPMIEHRYGFAENDPARNMDPAGLFPDSQSKLAVCLARAKEDYDLSLSEIHSNLGICTAGVVSIALAGKVSCLASVFGYPICLAAVLGVEAAGLASCIAYSENSKKYAGERYRLAMKRCQEDYNIPCEVQD